MQIQRPRILPTEKELQCLEQNTLKEHWDFLKSSPEILVPASLRAALARRSSVFPGVHSRGPAREELVSCLRDPLLRGFYDLPWVHQKLSESHAPSLLLLPAWQQRSQQKLTHHHDPCQGTLVSAARLIIVAEPPLLWAWGNGESNSQNPHQKPGVSISHPRTGKKEL